MTDENEVLKWMNLYSEEMLLTRRLLRDGAFGINRDPMTLNRMLFALQCGAISLGKARECIRLWLAGEPYRVAEGCDPCSPVESAKRWKSLAKKLRSRLRATR